MNESIEGSAAPVTQLLIADHERLDALLAETKRHLQGDDRARARGSFATFREGLEHHIVVEEEVLFPAFERHVGGGGGGPTAVMRAEHGDIRRLLEEVALALEGAATPPPTAPLGELTAILEAHNGKEEQILYPMTERALADDASSRAEIARRMRGASRARA